MGVPFGRRRLVLGAGVVLAAPAVKAQAAWPAQTVKIVCGYPPGGSTDAFARAYGDYAAQKLGQPFVVENKTGAASIIACEIVAKAAPDGYTLLFTNSTALFQNQVTYKTLPYDPVRDFVPVALFPTGHLPMYVHKDVPAKDVKAFIAWAKNNKVSFATYGPGSVSHVTCAKLNELYGLKMEPVHYRGEGAMWPDVAAGTCHAAVGSYQSALSAMQAGSVRPIAVPTMKRLKSKLPDIPTFYEQGLTHPTFLLEGMVGCLAPKGTPRAVVEKLSDVFVEAGKTERIQKILDLFGIDDAAQDWRALEAFMKDMGPQLIASVKELGLTPQ